MGSNVLTVESFEALAGTEALVPVHLSSTAENIVGVQFDITLPYAKSNSAPVLAASRKDGHSVSIRQLSNLKYTMVIMSFANKPLKGTSGLLLTFPVNVDASAQIGDTRPMRLENIVITTATGQNVAETSTSEATFTVQYEPTPDLVPQSLTISNGGSTLSPGGKMTVNFTVSNQGTRETGDGWTEKVYVKDESGRRQLVSTKSYSATLDRASGVSRLYEADLPQVMRMEGTVSAEVEIADLTNTGLMCAGNWYLTHQAFTLIIDETSINETSIFRERVSVRIQSDRV